MKLNKKGGASRLIVLLIIAVIALLLPIIWGIVIHLREDVDKRGCDIAVEEAQNRIDQEFILNTDMTLEEAVKAATSEVRSLDNICPSGGHCVVVQKKNGQGYEIYCELHGKE